MPITRFSLRAQESLEDHRDADQVLINVILDAVEDRAICEGELLEIRQAIAEVTASTAPLTGYMVRQDQAFRTIQMIANTGGMTPWVDEQIRAMEVDREIVPVPDRPLGEHEEGPAGTEPTSSNDTLAVAS